MELEGLRGIAAASVVLYHFLILFFPALRTGDPALAHTPVEQAIYGTPLTLFFAGTLAVSVFFVLSGFVLSIAFFQTRDDGVLKKLAASRYLRLMLPAFASVMLAFGFMSAGAGSITSAAGDVAQSTNLSAKWNSEISFLGALKSGVFDIFVDENAVQINGVLWTMYIEFVGSFIVFGFLFLFARSRHRWLAYLGLSAITFGSWFFAFVIGMAIADLYAGGHLKRLRRPSVVIPASVVGIVLGTYPRDANGTLYQFIDVAIPGTGTRMFFLIIAATLILLAVLLSDRLAGWLKHPAFGALGKYSFSLYLTHLFVIYVVSSSIVLSLHELLGYTSAVVIAGIVSLPVFWGVTIVFERYIDAPSIRIAKYVGGVYRGDQAIEWRRLVSGMRVRPNRESSALRFWNRAPDAE